MTDGKASDPGWDERRMKVMATSAGIFLVFWGVLKLFQAWLLSRGGSDIAGINAAIGVLLIIIGVVLAYWGRR